LLRDIVELQRIVIREKERVRKVRAKRKGLAKVEPKKAIPKPPLLQVFGEGVRDPIVEVTPEIKARIGHAGLRVTREMIDGHGPTDRDDDGTEYYQLIATMEHMTPHDIYTLFVSGNPYQS
jgi:hypothetical protein